MSRWQPTSRRREWSAASDVSKRQLLDALGTDFTIACPAFPANRRTLYKGYLYVGDELLNESGMKDHPLTPMTDANLLRVLSRQTPFGVGLIDMNTVGAGLDAIRAAACAPKADGVRHGLVDATSDAALVAIVGVGPDFALLTGRILYTSDAASDYPPVPLRSRLPSDD